MEIASKRHRANGEESRERVPHVLSSHQQVFAGHSTGWGQLRFSDMLFSSLKNTTHFSSFHFPFVEIISSGYTEIVGLRFQGKQKLAHNMYFVRLTAHTVDTMPVSRNFN